jgi:oxalate---CoA ligase
MALEFLPLIIEAQPRGPYRLCGYCTSGLVAFEVARLLAASGRHVEMVIMIDSPTVNARRSVQMLTSIVDRLRPADGSGIELATARIWYLITKLDTFVKHTPSKRWARAKAKASNFLASFKSKNSPPVPIDPQGKTIRIPKPFEYYHFWKYSIAMARYRPAHLSVKVVYFAADYCGESWQRVSEDLVVLELPGDHLQVLSDSSDLERHLQRILK